MSTINSVIFVCHGNICRSPLAEVIFLDKLKNNGVNNIKVTSAGISGYHEGEGACEPSLFIAGKHGLDLTGHRAKKIKNSDLNYDLIIAMDKYNYRYLNQSGAKNLKLLGDYGFNGDDIPDPYFRGNIEKVFNMIKKSIDNLFETEFS